MARAYLAFDIETAKDVPGEDFNWRPHRPLGISCAATLASDGSEARLWYGKTRDGLPEKRMSRETLEDWLSIYRKWRPMVLPSSRGMAWPLILTFSAEESGEAASCKECALAHVDMMFHVFCSLGYPVGLDKAAQGMGLPGKPPGMSGIMAPRLWAQGRFEEVLAYAAQDVRTALQIAQTCEQRRRLEWITRKGTKSSSPLTRGWLTVQEALRLPKPDTSWMSKPMSRGDFTAWTSAIKPASQ